VAIELAITKSNTFLMDVVTRVRISRELETDRCLAKIAQTERRSMSNLLIMYSTWL